MIKKVLRRLLLSNNDGMVGLQRRLFTEFQRGLLLNPGAGDWEGELHLPPDFGKALPERAVEMLLARILYRPGLRVLDVGHANAQPSHLQMILSAPEPRGLTGIDIAEPAYQTAPYYQTSIRGDIARTGLADGSFDLIWCISALEHFGMDNSRYTDDFKREPGLMERALGEMVRVLKMGGRLLVTVPFGKFEDHRLHVNFDDVHWQGLLDTVRDRTNRREWYFRHTFGQGWQQAPKQELEHVGYFDQANAGAGGLAAAVLTRTA